MASAICPQGASQLANRFLIGRDNRGCWTVRDERNLVGGTFVSQDAAIRFARQESVNLGSTAVLAGRVADRKA